MSIHENSDDSLVTKKSDPPIHCQTGLVQKWEPPPWACLLIAPASCAIPGLLISPKFLVLALVYGLTSVQPIYTCLRRCSSTHGSSSKRTRDDQEVREKLDAAIALHRSLTLQFSVLALCLWLYEHSRLLCMPKNSNVDDGGDAHGSNPMVHRAFQMAKRLIRWEHDLGLAMEPSFQGLVLRHCKWVIALANTYYAIFHFVAPMGVMARLIVYQKDPRYEYRLGFFVMLFLALVFFTLAPTMPPRLLPSYNAEYIETQRVALSEEDAQILEPYWHIVDTMAMGETLYDKLHKEGGNPYAAMPSMHTGWALWTCLTWIGSLDFNVSQPSRRYQTSFAISHLVCMVFVIIVTGNHFWLDAAAGAACVMLGRFLAHRVIQWLVRCMDGNRSPAQLLRRWQGHSWLLGPNKLKLGSETLEDNEYDEELTLALTSSPGSLSRSSSAGDLSVCAVTYETRR